MRPLAEVRRRKSLGTFSKGGGGAPQLVWTPGSEEPPTRRIPTLPSPSITPESDDVDKSGHNRAYLIQLCKGGQELVGIESAHKTGMAMRGDRSSVVAQWAQVLDARRTVLLKP